MDLIYMNGNMEDVGVLLDYEFDLAFGADENSFECTIQAAAHCCEPGYFLYISGTEYGGIIDSITSDTDSGEVTYSGRTWHGILNAKVIAPDSGADYLVLSGDAHSVISGLLERLGLTALFSAPDENSGLTVSGYKMPRYIAGYDGIRKMLSSIGGKIQLSFDGGKVNLTAVTATDYSKTEELDSDQIGFRVQRTVNAVNHLICLGSGELKDRMVLHLYVDGSGTISEYQTFSGLEEYAEVYDFPSVESADELESWGIERLRELRPGDNLTVEFGADSDGYDIGDIIGATDNITGISATAEIKKKILTIRNGQITISYEVGD